MARARVQSRRGPLVVGARRVSTWFDFLPVEVTQASPGTATLLFSLNAPGLALRPFTIVRTLLTIGVQSDQSAGNEAQTGAVGLAVVSDQSVAIGVTAVPTPITDMASDLWFAFKLWLQSGSSVNDGQTGFNYELDSKAMRKVDIGQDIILVVESSGTIGGGVIVRVGGRMLVKTH